MTTIYLIRHSVKFERKDYDLFNAKDDNNLRDEKTMLSVEGEKRAEILSKHSVFDNVEVIYASNMVRSMQTAKYLSTRLNLKINIDERLNERRIGKNSGKYNDWYQRQYKNIDFKTEGGESQREVATRMNDAINEILKNNKNKIIAVFSHGYAITYYLLKYCKLEDVNEKRVLKFSFNNKIVFNKIINAPEVFKLTFDDNKLIDIELIEFDDLPYMAGGI